MKRLLLLIASVLLVVGCANGESDEAKTNEASNTNNEVASTSASNDEDVEIQPLDFTNMAEFAEQFNEVASELGFPYQHNPENSHYLNDRRRSLYPDSDEDSDKDSEPLIIEFSFLEKDFKDNDLKSLEVGADTYDYSTLNPDEQKQMVKTAIENFETVIAVTSPSLDEAGRKDIMDELGITEESIANGWQDKIHERVVGDEAVYEFVAAERVLYSAALFVAHKDYPESIH